MPAPISSISGVSLPQAPSLETRGPAGGFPEAFATAVRDVEAFGQAASASVSHGARDQRSSTPNCHPELAKDLTTCRGCL